MLLQTREDRPPVLPLPHPGGSLPVVLMARPIPIGIDDFRTLREAKLEYVDKSGLIQQLLDRPGVEAVLLPRPRRFGKTLNLSMLRAWFEKRDEDLSPLFEDLSIWQAGEAYRAHFQRYPVIHFNFKGAKASTFSHSAETIREKIIDLFKAHRYLLDGSILDEVDRRRFQQILDGKATDALHERALLDLSAHLHAHHGEKVVILIDEYDEPIHAGHVHGYSKEILDFMRAFLGAGLKSNPHLFRAVVTGILRVAKENLFSGLNNLGVYTVLAEPFNDCFGFTEDEVSSLLQRQGRLDALDAVRAWYNGYIFGGTVIYNPWSVLCFLERGEETPQAYWLSTSSNDLVKELLERYAVTLEPVFEQLLEGGNIERPLDENVVFADLLADEGALWSLLVFSGYLKAEMAPVQVGRRKMYRLSIPNWEVREVYTTTFEQWMKRRLSSGGGSLDRLIRALLDGDAELVEEHLQLFVQNLLSYHDPGTLYPERVYQGFVVGLLAAMEPSYQVRSNRESGKGRPDVIIRPLSAGKPAVVLELKVARPKKKTLEQALSEGVSQLESMGYDAELLASGASVVHGLAVAFDGKEVRVQAAGQKAGAPG
ncbi:MAG: AAA family ATPase [Byssovorax sp.]